MDSKIVSSPVPSTYLTLTKRVPIAQEQADVALCDLRDIQAMSRMGKSWVYQQVKAGHFPAPVVQGHRCTRWRLADVRQYLLELGSKTA